MIGEIRDFETAQIAIQASLTGHLVLATLHTNDAPSAVTRLIDMGVEPFLLSSSCWACWPSAWCGGCARNAALRADGHWHRWAAPRACGHSGYKGRTGVYELMVADDRAQRASTTAPRRRALFAAAAAGLRAMREDGERLIRDGHHLAGRSAARHTRP